MLELTTIIIASLGFATILYLTGYMLELVVIAKKVNASILIPFGTGPFFVRLHYMSLAMPVLASFLLISGAILSVLNTRFFDSYFSAICINTIMSLGLVIVIYFIFLVVICFITYSITSSKSDYVDKIKYQSDKVIEKDCELVHSTPDFIYAVFKDDKCLHVIPQKNIVELYFGRSQKKDKIQKTKKSSKKEKNKG